jgi:hypothetical protein
MANQCNQRKQLVKRNICVTNHTLLGEITTKHKFSLYTSVISVSNLEFKQFYFTLCVLGYKMK